MVKSDRCVGSCNTLNDLSNKVYISNKREDLNLSVFNMITCINEWKMLTKDTYMNLMEQNVSQINGEITVNVDVSVKTIIYVKKIVKSPATCNCENGKYLASIMDDSLITDDSVSYRVIWSRRR